MRDHIQTERLTLRRPRLSDAHTMTKRINDPEILLMTATLPMPFFTLSGEFWLMRVAANWRRGHSYAYAITGTDDSLMGIVDLFKNEHGDWEIGYWLGKEFWGKGYMQEAAKALLTESFHTLDIPYIDAGYFKDNPGSGRVLEKLGFVSKNETSNLYSVARGERFAGIELRLPRNTAHRWSETTLDQAPI
ncbi:MAG: GNAT family N-acetyltransferase [Robiginitomaculum sp.]|nr:GNAT family N-acetyltransferase [Robiginitomaculum sp.]